MSVANLELIRVTESQNLILSSLKGLSDSVYCLTHLVYLLYGINILLGNIIVEEKSVSNVSAQVKIKQMVKKDFIGDLVT